MKFFVSYSRSVQDKTRQIITALRDNREDVWWDQDLRAGEDWWATILKNIEACEVCLFMISEKSVQSPYCMDELRYALARNRLVLPYVMDGPTISYTIPPEIMQGRIQYEIYDGSPEHLKYRIQTTCKSIAWNEYVTRYAPRPPEPNTGTSNLVDQLDKAVSMANEGYFDAAIKGFTNVSRNDYASYGTFCHTWIEKINRYKEIADLASRSAMKALARPKWEEFLRQYKDKDFFDPLGVAAALAVADLPMKRTGLLAAVKDMTAEEHLERGKEFYGKKDYERAIADYDEAIRMNSQFAEAYIRRGDSHYARKAYDLATRDYDTAIDLSPRSVNVYLRRGDCSYAQKQYDRALADYDRALNIDPHNLSAQKRKQSALEKKQTSED